MKWHSKTTCVKVRIIVRKSGVLETKSLSPSLQRWNKSWSEVFAMLQMLAVWQPVWQGNQAGSPAPFQLGHLRSISCPSLPVLRRSHQELAFGAQNFPIQLQRPTFKQTVKFVKISDKMREAIPVLESRTPGRSNLNDVSLANVLKQARLLPFDGRQPELAYFSSSIALSTWHLSTSISDLKGLIDIDAVYASGPNTAMLMHGSASYIQIQKSKWWFLQLFCCPPDLVKKLELSKFNSQSTMASGSTYSRKHW